MRETEYTVNEKMATTRQNRSHYSNPQKSNFFGYLVIAIVLFAVAVRIVYELHK